MHITCSNIAHHSGYQLCSLELFLILHTMTISCTMNYPVPRLDNIDENDPAEAWVPTNCPPPETPTESMEFLARSWSLSATELSKALTGNSIASDNEDVPERSSFSSLKSVLSAGHDAKPANLSEPVLRPIQNCSNTDNESPRDSGEVRELLLLHQALNPEFISNQQMLRDGLCKSIMKGKTMGRWFKDQKERKKQEARAHNAQLHAAISVAGVAAAVAAVAASTATFPEQPKSSSKSKTNFKASAAIASAAALVASHCIDLAEEMGANASQISAVVSSAVNARSNGDIMALTAGAATALRGAATLRARLQKGSGGPAIGSGEEKIEADRENFVSGALEFVRRGDELLKRTRKGALHWKVVSFNVDSSFQVVAKLKSKHMAGTFTKIKKFYVSGVCCDIPEWPGREEKADEGCEQKSYFGIKMDDRIVEFECKSKVEKQLWVEGIQSMLNYCSSMM